MAAVNASARSLRVLHVIPSLASGGAEVQIPILCRGLLDLGHEVHVAHFAGGPHLRRLQESGATLHRIPGLGNHDPTRLVRIAALVRRLRPDVMQTWLTMASVIGGFVAGFSGTPWVFAERYLPSGRREYWVKERLERWLVLRHAAAVVSNSEAADAEWAQQLAPGTRHAVIRNALVTRQLDAMPAADLASLGVPEGLPLVVYVGRIWPVKGVVTLLGALARANAERPLAALLLGEGIMEREIHERIRTLGLAGRVIAPGFRSDAVAWMKRAAVFVSLSHFEGMPNAVMEAMAARVPVVISDIAAHREILDDASGLFVAVDDAPAAADAILRTLADPVAAAQRARLARLRAEAWSAEAATRAYAAIYQQIAPPRPRLPEGPG